jgi:hypothetical protein
MTEEQYNKLKPYETHLQMAYYSNCIRCVEAGEVRGMESIYNELGYKLHNRTCGECVLTMCKVLGKLYFTFALPKSKENDKEAKRKKTNASKAES